MGEAQGAHRWGAPARGATLLEAMVAIIVLVGFAALAMPQYLRFKARAVDAEVRTVLRSARTAMEAHFIDQRSYTNDLTVLVSWGYERREGVTVTVLSVDPEGYALRACAAGGSHDAWEYRSYAARAGETIGLDGVRCSTDAG